MLDLQAYCNIYFATAQHNQKKYQNKLLSDKYYSELPEFGKLQLSEKLKIKEDLKNSRAATLFYIL